MHELSVTESILEITLRHAQGAGAKKVKELFIVVGQLSSIVDDSVQFYWDIVAEGTLAAGARLNFRRIPAELKCTCCGKQYAPTPDELACPQCGSMQVKVIAGEEFFLEAIDVEK